MDAPGHSSKTWKIEFDHAHETGFALAGSHARLNCESCHVTNINDPLPTDCEGCHSDDDPHQGTLGNCDGCRAARFTRSNPDA